MALPRKRGTTSYPRRQRITADHRLGPFGCPGRKHGRAVTTPNGNDAAETPDTESNGAPSEPPQPTDAPPAPPTNAVTGDVPPAPPAPPTNASVPPAPPSPASDAPVPPAPPAGQMAQAAPPAPPAGESSVPPAPPVSEVPPAPQYGQPQGAFYGAPTEPSQQFPAQYSPAGYPPAPVPPRRKRTVMLASIIGGAVLVAAAGIGTVAIVSSQDSGSSESASSKNESKSEKKSKKEKPEPTSTKTPTPTPTPTGSATAAPKTGSGEEDRPVYGPDDPEIGGTGTIGERLEAFSNELKQSNDDGTLWTKIPKTKENLGAYLAVQFIITDLKSATYFGTVDAETETFYAKHAKHMELMLLAEQPLGSSVHYVMQDGSVFDYNGDTGEVSMGTPTQ